MILPLYNLRERGSPRRLKRCIYKTEKIIETNRGIFLSENKIVSKTELTYSINVLELSSKCRILFDDNITIVEFDGKNIQLAQSILISLTTNDDTNDNVYFLIDDDLIIDDKDDTTIKMRRR
jgi:hypothetical protein